MYIRFETSIRDDWSRCNHGIFSAAYKVQYESPELKAHWQTQQIWKVVYWFNDNLEAPDQLDWRGGKKSMISGVCWFRDNATRYVSQARYLSWLLNDLGFYVTERRQRNPGRVIWQDAHQVVASPYL